ncbi:hypothetical protein ACJX0J_021043, partial [Zea mays]
KPNALILSALFLIALLISLHSHITSKIHTILFFRFLFFSMIMEIILNLLYNLNFKPKQVKIFL